MALGGPPKLQFTTSEGNKTLDIIRFSDLYFKMKQRTLFLLFGLFIGPICSTLSAQSNQDAYLKIDYIYVEPANINIFLSRAETQWVNVQHARVENKKLIRWAIYSVPFRGNHALNYNFVSIEIASHPDYFESDGHRAEFQHQIPSTIQSVQEIVHSEIWLTQSTVGKDASEVPARYLNANYMKVTGTRLQDYLDLERIIARPLHQQQMENDRMEGWNFYQLIFPSGSVYPYNFMTADFYRNVSQVENGITKDMIAETHPDLNMDEFDDYANAIRTRVWSDLWELLWHVSR
jgi:hypothetical protein